MRLHSAARQPQEACAERSKSPVQSLIALGKALSDPLGIRVLALLNECPCSLSGLIEALSTDRSALRTRIERLVAAGCLTARREGREICYRIAESQRELVAHILRHHEEELSWDAGTSNARWLLRQNQDSDQDLKVSRK